MTVFQFGTKAETLDRLAQVVGSQLFCPQLYFTAGEWRTEKPKIAEKIVTVFSSPELVVRSSRKDEDGAESSMAGAFLSLVGVARDPSAVTSAVDRVIGSYGRFDATDQVLVQPRVRDVDLSGVITTRHLDTGAPYYVINYDDVTGRTDTVTSGAQSKVVLVHRERSGALRSPRLGRLIAAVSDIEVAVGSGELDIEFCITRSNEVYIFQVRPLAASRVWSRVSDHVVDREIDAARDLFRNVSSRAPGLAGPSAIFGQMPDWNPAEMIGSLPRPLAYSLYKNLITDYAWAEGRHRMGYRDLRGTPLMHSFAGQPYIDVRASLNSFLPADISPGVAERLIDFQLQKLAQNREMHDRIEFTIAIPSYDFAFDERRGELDEAGLTKNEIEGFRAALIGLTRSIVESGPTEMPRLDAQTAKLASAVKRHSAPSSEDIAELLNRSVDDGAVPFAMLARHGFIAVTFLKSLVKLGVLTQNRVDAFIGGIRTVAAEFLTDLYRVHSGQLSQNDFLATYGHLRPGTYDIVSPRYDSAPEFFLSGSRSKPVEHPAFSFTAAELEKIDQQLQSVPIDLPVGRFTEYLAEAIRLRELAKFRYTIGVSSLLELIAKWGAARGLSRDQLSFMPLEMLRGGEIEDRARHASANCDDFRARRLVCLPHLILEARDFDVIRLPLNLPTFITDKSAVCASVRVSASGEGSILGKIVMIESADPGFDWIFSYEIAGLVTKFGGANSHMAIRCAEFGLPAAIGCGERLFSTLEKGRMLELNCANQIVRVVS